MERELLKELLAEGMSAAQIGERVGKGTNTVYYWIEKYGLKAVNHERHAARGGVDREVLEDLVRAGRSIDAIAETVGRSPGTVRHWLAKYELETRGAVRRRQGRAARESGADTVQLNCHRHGLTDFWLEGRGYFRCLKCRHEAVSRTRRRAKQILVDEAGGACAICGYSRYAGALQFHHLDPATKSFAVSTTSVRSLARMREEAAKCVLLCGNCHAEVESGMVELPIH
jgi:transposase